MNTPAYEEQLAGQLPGQADDFNTLRQIAVGHRNSQTVPVLLSADELFHLDADRKKFLVDLTKHIRAGGTVGDVSDGYHTFNELYDHRALLFFSICHMHPELAWKSKQHDNPDFPMFDGMFICGIETPEGQATYHYDVDPYWDMLQVKELERAPEYDGHTPKDALNRIYRMLLPQGE